ncbi:anaerobic ribonucleoside-triphosphate reductase activating protein [Flavobacterium sp. J49]|uniref:anaerobic ribonucleoside-triphosphate reductase activating protein n=1 Tax=Flavobacterium sp. J49 TaxID=2718534 RepID=UPI0015938883|nr:anaerobic ribonucleoside-triphosphate reductase activating protein [Flavobacterium sp. J49]MBF6641599.1 anaerobic ribonucleoside-triphosphate reductase activating protein [Flavobacterium sp. J49]NIC02846.1 anaerobic ribonucleoside-triphosphate reductase activating protein [Flavobacterium sp. J49]
MVKSVSNITPFTLLDYPDKSACILWYAGCNMRCLYCYNPEIVFGKGKFTFSEMISFLETRRGLLDAVVFSGGECLIHKDIIEQIRLVKAMGFLVKVDTNGSKPDVLQSLIEQKLLDYVALDFKSTRESFLSITQTDLYDQFEQSVQLLFKTNIPFEIRTTYHSELLAKEEVKDMIDYLKFNEYTGTYYIQHFKNNVETIGKLPNSHTRLENHLPVNTAIKIVLR